MNNFEILGLYPHNIEASTKVKEQFDDGAKTASIIHATGTGKTYNALYLALEYKNEKIVWLVPSNAIKEHIEQIINDNPYITRDKDFPNLEIRTYQSLINLNKKEIEEISCSFLIIDEFHHLGAPIWGERVNTFIKTHKDLKLFGMTAYNIRDRGTPYERDLTNPETEEIFSDSVESIYDLYDAMIDGVLPKPITKSVITEDSEIILEIKEKIEILKRKGDKSYLEYEKMIADIIKIIHKQNGVKELIKQSVKPTGKYIYFCPVLTEEGKNDMETIMSTIKEYLQEKYPEQNIVFYKSTSADGEYGKYHRDCFYNDIDLKGNDVSNSIRIIFVKNQYNEGVHAPNVDGVFLGRKTSSDIVAFEQIGRALSVRGNTHEKNEEYRHYSIEQLREIATSRGIFIKETETKEGIIEKLISPIIIDLADNMRFLEELEINLGYRIREYLAKTAENKRIIRITDSTIDIDVINKDLLKILKQIKTNLNTKTWDDWYKMLEVYYQEYGDTEVPLSYKTKDGFKLGSWVNNIRTKKDKLTQEKRTKLELLNFRFERRKKRTMKWDDWYKLLETYYQVHGNTDVPYRFKTTNGWEYDEEGDKLGEWCRRQRDKQSELSEERRKKLESINFRFEKNKRQTLKWDDWYKLLEAYYQEYGDTEVPPSYQTKDGYKLGGWVNNTRTNQNKLTEEQRKKLEKLNFRFDTKKHLEKREDWYKLLEAYYQKHGNTEVPPSFKTINGYEYDENGQNLGNWCDHIRRRGNLTQEENDKLDLIGFRFTTKKQTKEKKLNLCLKHAIDYSKFKFLENISYQELYSKIMFLIDRKEPLKIEDKLHEIFYMSNENMKQKYKISKEELITKYYINDKERGI